MLINSKQQLIIKLKQIKMKKQRTILVALLLVIMTSAWAQSKTIYVDESNTSGTYNGLTWATAFNTLQPALDVANADDIIFVAQGKYIPTKIAGNGTQDRDKAFVLLKDVKIFGGFPSGGAVMANRDWNAYPTILSGDLTGNDIATTPTTRDENALHVVISAGDVGTACLDGFTITGGNANISGPSSISVNSRTIYRHYGGGIIIVTSSPTLTNVIINENNATQGGGIAGYDTAYPIFTNAIISNNSTTYSGGGMYNASYCYPTMTDVAIIDNYTDGRGGGIHSDHSSPILTRATISGNTAGTGGGICNNAYASPILTDVIINNNHAGIGGGIGNFGFSDPIITNTIIRNNSTGDRGAGMTNENASSPILYNVTISDNIAGSYGGGVCNDHSSSPVFANVTISGNKAGTRGGGMFNRGGAQVLVNVIISGNTGSHGGGMLIANESSTTLTNVIISGNSDYYGSGGIHYQNAVSIKLYNTVIWGNKSTGMSDETPMETSTLAFYHCLIQGESASTLDAFGGSGNFNDSDPVFVSPLASPGLSSGGNFHLQPVSPIIDKGSYDYWSTAGHQFASISLEDSLSNLGIAISDLDNKLRLMGSAIDLGPYETVTCLNMGILIGNYVWQEENIAETGGYSYYHTMHPDSIANKSKYGLLYDFATAQAVCPVGWHLPDSTAIAQLLSLYTSPDLKAENEWIAGVADDNIGFTALPAGMYNASADRYELLKGDAFFWTADGKVIHLDCNCGDIKIETMHWANRVSVRCVRLCE